MDAVYTVDPKTVREVDHGIDVPYPVTDIVETGSLRLGPSFRALAPYASALAIVNSVRQNSANHQSGLLHTTRFKSYATPSSPSLFDILGARRTGEAVGAVSIGTAFATGYSPKYLGELGTFAASQPGLFSHLDAVVPEDLIRAANALAREADALDALHKQMAETNTADNLRDASRFLRGVASAPKFTLADWTHPSEAKVGSGPDVQRALWLLEHGLARCVTVSIANDNDFDTHMWNTTLQPMLNEYLAFVLGKVFDELGRRIVDGVPLAQQTAVIVGSEIGRFPRLNAGLGKDHFPQASYLFYGPWFAGGRAYGASGRDMVSLPVALATGRPDRGGHSVRLDDVGTTLLALDGADPEMFGYVGERLGFLMA
jgi:uncharacterized protein (DUF1501 family)